MQRIHITGLLLMTMAGCAQKPVEPPPAPRVPDSYVVLMENPDGSTGQIIVRDNFDQGTTVERAGDAVRLAEPAAGATALDAEKLERDFGDTLAARPELPKTYMLYFKSGGTQLTAESEALIPEVLREVQNRAAPDISIIGHTDTVGKADANEALALERAQAIAETIVKAGLQVKELTVASHGERNLLVATPDETAEERNRRIEITIR